MLFSGKKGWLLACVCSHQRVLADEEQRLFASEDVPMMRRTFFAIPDAPHARRVVDELQAAGIDREQMHARSKSGAELTDLPVATREQGQDRVWALDKLLWNADLVLFALAIVGLCLRPCPAR
jgi:hypothetical protein